MKQLTLRGFNVEIERVIRDVAAEEGISLNQAALRLLQEGAGSRKSEAPGRRDLVGSSLDQFMGRWTEDEAREFTNAVSDFERVDQDLWR